MESRDHHRESQRDGYKGSMVFGMPCDKIPFEINFTLSTTHNTGEIRERSIFFFSFLLRVVVVKVNQGRV